MRPRTAGTKVEGGTEGKVSRAASCFAAGRRCGPGLCADSTRKNSTTRSVWALTTPVKEHVAEAAEAMISEVREDEPALAGDLRIEAIEL